MITGTGIVKSSGAFAAERKGRFPASLVAKELGVPAGFVRDTCEWACGGEWHCTSKYRNRTRYYDCNAILLWKDGDAEAVRAHGGFEQALVGWKAKQRVVVHSGVTVAWREWMWDGFQRRSFERSAEGATVVDAGATTVTVRLADGREFRKKRDSAGFKIHKDGVRVWLDRRDGVCAAQRAPGCGTTGASPEVASNDPWLKV